MGCEDVEKRRWQNVKNARHRENLIPRRCRGKWRLALSSAYRLGVITLRPMHLAKAQK